MATSQTAAFATQAERLLAKYEAQRAEPELTKEEQAEGLEAARELFIQLVAGDGYGVDDPEDRAEFLQREMGCDLPRGDYEYLCFVILDCITRASAKASQTT